MTSGGVQPVLLLSLPRSGSTLLQRLLGAHSEVATAPEPWVLLPFLYALRPDDVYAEYGHRVAVSAVAEFLDRLPDGVECGLNGSAQHLASGGWMIHPPTVEVAGGQTHDRGRQGRGVAALRQR